MGNLIIMLGPVVLLLGIGTANTKGTTQKVFLGVQLSVFLLQITLFALEMAK